MCFLNAACLEWFEVTEWPISFPIMKNQSAPDRCDFIQSGFMLNDFWWPLSPCPIHAEMLPQQQGLDHYRPPPHPSGQYSSTALCRVPDWISHTFRACTLLIYTNCKARNLCWSVFTFVCPSHISRTVHHIYFTRARCISWVPRMCSLVYAVLWLHEAIWQNSAQCVGSLDSLWAAAAWYSCPESPTWVLHQSVKQHMAWPPLKLFIHHTQCKYNVLLHFAIVHVKWVAVLMGLCVVSSVEG